MIIFLFIIGFIVGMFIYTVRKNIKDEEFRKEWAKTDKEIEERTRKSIVDTLEERKRKPLLCEVCTKKKSKKTYFEGLAWYHCPICNQHGFASIYPTSDGKACCTGCSNLQRFGYGGNLSVK